MFAGLNIYACVINVATKHMQLAWLRIRDEIDKITLSLKSVSGKGI